MKKLSIDKIAELPQHDLNAYLGMSGHSGGVKASRKLMELTKIRDGKHILDVGCGIGNTSFYIAKKYKCDVTGVDLSEIAIERANMRRKRSYMKNRLKFLVADIQLLPFEDESFDVVIVENVLSLIGDKQMAIKETLRVTKPSGFIGNNICFWVKKSPSLSYNKETNEIEEESRIYRTKIYVFPTFSEWEDLFKKAGFAEVQYYDLSKGTVMDKVYDRGEKISYLKVLMKILYLSCKSKKLKTRFLIVSKHQKEIKKGTEIGAGLFICKK